tara:strand:+ start:4431 stop:4982 length:552 start_codon:yes stop_codon:yes gene_type:complete
MSEQPKLSKNASVMLLNISMGVMLLVSLVVLIEHIQSANESADARRKELRSNEMEILELKPLPEKPVEKWQYIELLENMEVEVSTVVRKKDKQAEYILWCGSFREKYRADNMAANIKEVLPAYTVERGEWHIVNTKPFHGKRLGERIRHKLRREYNITTCNFKRARYDEGAPRIALSEDDVAL